MGQRDPFTLYHDPAGTWYAVPPGFGGIVRDPIGVGTTQGEAIRDLCQHPEFVHRARLGEWPVCPGPCAFVECGRREFLLAALTSSIVSMN
jgi:hypothetical protein